MTVTPYLYSVRMLITPKTFKIYVPAYLMLWPSIKMNALNTLERTDVRREGRHVRMIIHTL